MEYLTNEIKQASGVALTSTAQYQHLARSCCAADARREAQGCAGVLAALLEGKLVVHKRAVGALAQASARAIVVGDPSGVATRLRAWQQPLGEVVPPQEGGLTPCGLLSDSVVERHTASQMTRVDAVDGSKPSQNGGRSSREQERASVPLSKLSKELELGIEIEFGADV